MNGLQRLLMQAAQDNIFCDKLKAFRDGAAVLLEVDLTEQEEQILRNASERELDRMVGEYRPTGQMGEA